ncbi:hypothetical protein [Calothrix sp. PCC 7507]|nr:hypothetical protein [Calothrix sp. PCC 7507]
MVPGTGGQCPPYKKGVIETGARSQLRVKRSPDLYSAIAQTLQ